MFEREQFSTTKSRNNMFWDMSKFSRLIWDTKRLLKLRLFVTSRLLRLLLYIESSFNAAFWLTSICEMLLLFNLKFSRARSCETSILVSSLLLAFIVFKFINASIPVSSRMFCSLAVSPERYRLVVTARASFCCISPSSLVSITGSWVRSLNQTKIGFNTP